MSQVQGHTSAGSADILSANAPQGAKLLVDRCSHFALIAGKMPALPAGSLFGHWTLDIGHWTKKKPKRQPRGGGLPFWLL